MILFTMCALNYEVLKLASVDYGIVAVTFLLIYINLKPPLTYLKSYAKTP